MMLFVEYPTPPPFDYENMDPNNRLPPITTEKPSTPPISPEEYPRKGQPSSLKRKRSEDDLALPGSRTEQWKRPAVESSVGRPISSVLHGQGRMSTPELLNAQHIAPSGVLPALEPPLLRSSPNQQLRSEAKHAAQESAPGASSPWLGQVSREYHTRTPSQGEKATISAPTSRVNPVSPPRPTTSRDLPPLRHPESPRGHLDRKFDKQIQTDSAVSFGPMESVIDHRQPSSRITYPAKAEHNVNRPAPPTYPSPNQTRPSTRKDPLGPTQLPPPPPPQPLHPPPPSLHAHNLDTKLAPYSFDPVRSRPTNPQPTHVTRSDHRILPPVAALTDRIPQYQAAAAATTSQIPASQAVMNTSPPNHSMDRYRFDANPPTEHPARRRRGNLPKEATARLNQWFAEHASYPYPKEEEKQRLQEQTGLTMSQIGNWFINARRRRRPSTTTRLVEQQPDLHPPGMPLTYPQQPPLPPPLSQAPPIAPYYGAQERHVLPPQFDFNNRLPPYQGPPAR